MQEDTESRKPLRRKRNSLLHRLKAQQELELTRETSSRSHMQRRRPKPSMPKLPWDNKQ